MRPTPANRGPSGAEGARIVAGLPVEGSYLPPTVVVFGFALIRTRGGRALLWLHPLATRRKFPAEEKIRIVMEGIRAKVSVVDLCRREGIHPTIYYKWLKDFLEAGKGRLRGDAKREATSNQVQDLRQENERLKLLVADLSLENF